LLRDPVAGTRIDVRRGKRGGTAVRLFHKFASTVETSTADIAKLADPVERTSRRAPVQLAPLDRQALLLVHQQEGFSQAEAAEILQLNVAEVGQRNRRGMGSLKRSQPRAC